MKFQEVFFGLLLVAAFSNAEIIDNVQCSVGRDARNIRSEVHEIRVIPCAEAVDGEPCRLKKGSTATIEVDFTPSVNVRRPRAGMYWISTIDLIFRGLKANACRDMPCPLRANNRYTYSASIPLGRELPAGRYPIKLKVYERRNVVFCQTLNIHLVEADD